MFSPCTRAVQGQVQSKSRRAPFHRLRIIDLLDLVDDADDLLVADCELGSDGVLQCGLVAGGYRLGRGEAVEEWADGGRFGHGWC